MSSIHTTSTTTSTTATTTSIATTATTTTSIATTAATTTATTSNTTIPATFSSFTEWWEHVGKNSSLCIISVIGPHAGEGMKEIYERKQLDITNVGYTLWSVNMSTRKYVNDNKKEMDFVWAATAPEARLMCEEASAAGKDIYIIFVCTDGKGNEGVPTKLSHRASHYWTDSKDNKIALPDGLSPLTGNMTETTGAYKFDQMIIFEKPSTIDLKKFGMWRGGDSLYAIKTTLGVGNVCAKFLPADAVKIGKEMTKTIRTVQGVARLCSPFAVQIYSEEKEAAKSQPKEKRKKEKQSDETQKTKKKAKK